MARIRVAAILLACMVPLLPVAPAAAQACIVEIHDHNGSDMKVEICGQAQRISYAAPRKELLAHRVKAGAWLVDAKLAPDGTISDKARGGFD